MKTSLIKSWFGLTLLAAAACGALPPEIDPGVKLDAARKTYEDAVEDIRVQIDKRFSEEEANLANKPGSDDAIDKLVELRKKFYATGEVPTTLKAQAMLQDYQKQRKALIAAYDAAGDGYNKVKLYDLRKQMRKESAALAEEDDLRQWGENFAAKPTTLDAATATWTLPDDVTEAYRVDVSGQIDPGSAATIELPLLNGTRVAFPIQSAAGGTFRFIATVREQISVDLGADRQIKPADADEGKQISLRVTGGKLTVTRACKKPVQKKGVVAAGVKGGQLTTPAEAAKGDKVLTNAKAEGASILPVKSVWRGTYEQIGDSVPKRNVTARVLNSADDSAEMEVKIVGHATRIYHFGISGSSLTLQQNEGVGQVPGTSSAANRIDNLDMTITLEGKKLTITGSQTVTYPDGKLLGNIRSTLVLAQQGSMQ